MSSSVDAIVVATSIVLSAGTYLFDFGSNVVILVEYSTHFLRSLHHDISSCNVVCRHRTNELALYFYALLAILVCCHSLNAILFKLKFTHNEAPLLAAYFLPFIHLHRLFHLLYCTFSCKGIDDLRSPEMNGLYCILGSAMEGIPMLVLQFCGYLMLTGDGVLVQSMSTTFKVSVAASLVSAAYNGGTSVQSIANNAATRKQKLGAGAIGATFMLSATLVRCLTVTYLVVYARQYLHQEHVQAALYLSDFISALGIVSIIAAYFLCFWLLPSPRGFSKSLWKPHRLLTALAFGYMSVYVGPLYPLISQANDANQLGRCMFRLKLLALSLLHLLPDLAVLCVTNMLGSLPRPYLIVSLLTTVGYMVSLIAYIKFDASCGPTTSSNVSTLPAAQGDNDVNDRTLIHLSDLCMLITNAQPQEIETSEVDANPSSQNTNSARSEKAEAMGCPYIGTHPHDVHLPQAKGCMHLLTSSFSLDRSSKAACSSINRPLIRAYSERKETRGHPLNSW